MKKIKFGYSLDDNPTGSWSGIGIEPGKPMTNGDYIGSFNHEGNDYVLARISDNNSSIFKHEIGKYIVRDALVDVYADGSNVMYLDLETSSFAQQMETAINERNKYEDIEDINKLAEYNDNINISHSFFRITEDPDNIIATSIKHEAFEEKRDLLKNCHQSFIELQRDSVKKEMDKGNAK